MQLAPQVVCQFDVVRRPAGHLGSAALLGSRASPWLQSLTLAPEPHRLDDEQQPGTIRPEPLGNPFRADGVTIRWPAVSGLTASRLVEFEQEIASALRA